MGQRGWSFLGLTIMFGIMAFVAGMTDHGDAAVPACLATLACGIVATFAED